MCAAFYARAANAPDVGDDVVPMGDNTFSITRQAGSTFTRSSDKLKSQVQQEASDYCAAQGKMIKIVSLSGKVPTFGLGYASAKIVFKALNPGDPELATGLVQVAGQVPISGQAPIYVQVPTYAAAPPPPPAPKQLTTDDLYASLMKLDDLRKKGILTDDEFQAEKKKLLTHTN
jgi:hypothetical protein